MINIEISNRLLRDIKECNNFENCKTLYKNIKEIMKEFIESDLTDETMIVYDDKSLEEKEKLSELIYNVLIGILIYFYNSNLHENFTKNYHNKIINDMLNDILEESEKEE